MAAGSDVIIQDGGYDVIIQDGDRKLCSLFCDNKMADGNDVTHGSSQSRDSEKITPQAKLINNSKVNDDVIKLD